MLERILRGAGSDALKYFPARLVPALTSLVTVPVFTRLIDKADYGNFYLITSATSLAAAFATAWITSSVVRFYWVYEDDDRADEYVGTSVWTAVASLLAVAAVLVGTVWLVSDSISADLLKLIPLGIASLCVTYFAGVLMQMLRAANKAASYATTAITVSLLGTGFSLYLVGVVEMGAMGILLGMVLGNALVLPWTLWKVHRQGSLAPTGWRRDIAREYISYGFPLVPAAISSWLLVLADRYIIEFTRTTAEVGMYSVAYGLGEKLMQLITLPMIIAIGPVMIRTFEKHGQKLAQDVQTQLTRYYLLVTIPVLTVLAAASEDFMTVFTGPQYHEAYPILPIVAASALGYGMTQIAGNGVALHKKTTITMSNTLAAGAFNIIANLILVPRYGYMAAAYTTLASYGLLLALTWVRSRPYMAWKLPWKDVALIAVAAAATWIAIYVVFGSSDGSLGVLIAEALLGAAVYVAIVFATKAVRDDERAYLLDLASRAVKRVTGRR